MEGGGENDCMNSVCGRSLDCGIEGGGEKDCWYSVWGFSFCCGIEGGGENDCWYSVCDFDAPLAAGASKIVGSTKALELAV